MVGHPCSLLLFRARPRWGPVVTQMAFIRVIGSFGDLGERVDLGRTSGEIEEHYTKEPLPTFVSIPCLPGVPP